MDGYVYPCTVSPFITQRQRSTRTPERPLQLENDLVDRWRHGQLVSGPTPQAAVRDRPGKHTVRRQVVDDLVVRVHAADRRPVHREELDFRFRRSHHFGAAWSTSNPCSSTATPTPALCHPPPRVPSSLRLPRLPVTDSSNQVAECRLFCRSPGHETINHSSTIVVSHKQDLRPER